MTVKCTFCNDTKQEPGFLGICVWCEDLAAIPKYEDVVAKLDAALGHEAAGNNIIAGQRTSLDVCAQQINTLQQRLTVAELLLSQVEGACDLAMSAIGDDGRGANFVKIIQAIKDKAALKPAAEGEGS